MYREYQTHQLVMLRHVITEITLEQGSPWVGLKAGKPDGDEQKMDSERGANYLSYNNSHVLA